MTWTTATYLAYLALTVPLVVAVATTLSRNGRVSLLDVFDGDERQASAVDQLLVVGFYLLNLGFVGVYLQAGVGVHDLTGLIATLGVKIGVVSLVLGLLHAVNVMILGSMRRHHRLDVQRTASTAGPRWTPTAEQGPPMPPPGWVAPGWGGPVPQQYQPHR